MFTGIVEAVCRARSIQAKGCGLFLTVDLERSAEDTKVGDSIAINGVCLTVCEVSGGCAGFDVSGETLAKSSLGSLQVGSEVNVERAIRADGRFGGHFVQGHIDGTGRVEAIERRGEFAEIRISAEKNLLDEMVAKGSVAVDGVSLTIAAMDQRSFRLALIPETLKRTTLGKVKAGDVVNIETDIIAKIVKKQLEAVLPGGRGLTEEKLKALGF